MKLYSVPEGLDFVKNLLHIKKKKHLLQNASFYTHKCPFTIFF